jgi:hypothetical protein
MSPFFRKNREPKERVPSNIEALKGCLMKFSPLGFSSPKGCRKTPPIIFPIGGKCAKIFCD